MPANSMNRVLQNLRSTLLQYEGAERNDAQLLEFFIERRDEAAAEILIKRHGPMVLGVCRRLLRNERDVEDAFQATFLVLVRKAASIRPREMVGNWLYGVAYQTARRAKVAAARRWARERQVTSMPEPETAPKSTWEDLVPLLDQELSRLPAKYRSAIVLCDLEGKTHKQAARQVGCPVGTLSARLARGRTMLAKRLSRHGPAISGGMLAAILSEKIASAAVPATLAASTARVVHVLAAGEAASAGVVSAKVAALTEGVLKAMLVSKLKVVAGLLVLAAMAVLSAGALRTTTAAAQPARKPSENNSPAAGRGVTSGQVIRVPSRLDGIVLFIGTEIAAGEQVPPEKVVPIQVDGQTRKHRRLQKGDHVKEGQLLARLDDRQARAQLAVREAKVKLAKADFDGAKAIADEAENKLKTATALYAKGAIALEEYRSAVLTRDRFWFASIEAKGALKQAEVELESIKPLLAMHEIRSPASGVIRAIRIQAGEAAKKLETVLEIETHEAGSNGSTEQTARNGVHIVKVPNQSDGVILFVGKVAMAEGKESIKQWRKGDKVKAGDLLAQLDDRLERANLAVKESKVSSGKATLDGAKAIADEAENKLKTAKSLFDKGSIAQAEYRSALLTRDKMWFDSISKIEAWRLAEREVTESRLSLKKYEIRANASGVISAVLKHRGEAVKEWETVFEIEVPD